MGKKIMLINAAHEEQSRVAIVEDGYLQELDIESAHKAQTKNNIYRGRVTRIEPSLQAAFVEYGAQRQGFLPLTEIHPDYWKEGVDKNADPRQLNIQDVLEPKQELLVQVVKEERGNKGAALTTLITLAGRYLVLNPNTNRSGISRKLPEEDRRAMKAILAHLEVPDGMGLILRTAGKDQRLEALQRDYLYLRRLWDEIRIKGETTPSPALIYLESSLATRAIRDHYTDDIVEIWVDNHDIYAQTKEFVHAVLPGKEKLVKLYRGKKPLFRYFGVESQCEQIYEREVRLASGASIVIDSTEALTAIDINSSRATKDKHIHDTALNINLEAAKEIARQLRMRDIGGLIVIDFIDMATRKHAQQVEDMLREACKQDKARIQIGRISRFGLLEMSRQRIHPSVNESIAEDCPRCQGKGYIHTVESMVLLLLSRIEDFAEAGKKPTLVVQASSDVGEYLMNRKREHIARIEDAYDVQVTLQIRPDLERPHYRIERKWYKDNQQHIEVLEDTSKQKRMVNSGRKLKPVKPVVGIPQAMPEEKKRLGKLSLSSVIKNVLDVLTGRKRREEMARRKEEEMRAEEERRKQAAAKNRRRRRRRRRRRGGAAGSSQQNRESAAAAAGKAEVDAAASASASGAKAASDNGGRKDSAEKNGATAHRGAEKKDKDNDRAASPQAGKDARTLTESPNAAEAARRRHAEAKGSGRKSETSAVASAANPADRGVSAHADAGASVVDERSEPVETGRDA